MAILLWIYICYSFKLFFLVLAVNATLISAGVQKVIFVSMHSYTSLAYSQDYINPAIDLALADVNRKYYPEFQFTLINMNKTTTKICADVERDVLPFMTDFWNKRISNAVVAIIAPGCSNGVVLLGDLAREWQIPIVTAAGTDTVLDSRVRFPTLLRLLPYQQNPLAGFTANLFAYYNWSDIAVICDSSATESNFYALICGALPNFLRKLDNINSASAFTYDFKKNPNYRSYLLEASRVSRVFVLITHASRLRQLLVAAQKLGMAEGNYVFIAYEPFPSPAFGKMSWKYNDKDDLIVRQAFDYLLVISTILPEDSNELDYLDDQIKNSSRRIYGKIYDEDEDVSPFVYAYYYGVYVLAEIISQYVNNSNNGTNLPKNPSKLAWNRKFTTPMGSFLLNDNGDKDNDYVMRMQSEDSIDVFRPKITWNKTTKTLDFVDLCGKSIWPHNSSAPANRPVCGFLKSSSQCDKRTGFPTDLVVAAIAVIVGLSVSLLAGFFRYKKHLEFFNLKKSTAAWMISCDELKPARGSTFATASGHSTRLQISVDTTSKKRSSVWSVDMKNRVMQYRGNRVWIRYGTMPEECMTIPVIVAINLRKLLRHANIANLVGVTVENTHLWTITEYFNKGSLDHLLSSQNHGMERALQYSLLADIINGMVAIHQSAIKRHGSFKPSNCMITGQLGIKLTDFGLPFLNMDTIRNALKNGDYRGLLWTSPEVLQNPVHPVPLESEVFGFGIMMHEVLFLADPFQAPESRDTMTLFKAKAIVECLMSHDPAFRPPVQSGKIPTDWQSLMERCWDKSPAHRPTFREVLRIVDISVAGRRGFSYVDSVIHRLEKYAEDLEEQVADRTTSLMDEKHRTEQLLEAILPRPVAKALVTGRTITPEMFESASVAFTGLWEFAALIATESPLAIISILNDLYMCVDDILCDYDVYKVETIKDNYMLASGVPIRNGDAHAFQAAKLCLAILLAANEETFGDRRVKLAIGLHCGPLAAGVVGQRMPRYCLFGDTINVASRMMSTGEPQQIQISDAVRSLIIKDSQTFICDNRGEVLIKGIGLMKTFWLKRRKTETNNG